MTQITLPAVFAINESFRGNTTQQLLIRETTIEGTIANYQANRFKSKVIVPRSHQDERILLVDRASSVANNLARTIRVSPKKLSDDAALSHLTEDRWIAHPEMVRQNRDVLDRRGRLQAVIDSWRGAFSYIAEEPEKGIKGLRTPQIGAVHIIHGLRSAFAGCTATKNRLNYSAICSDANPRRANLEKRLASRRVMKIN